MADQKKGGLRKPPAEEHDNDPPAQPQEAPEEELVAVVDDVIDENQIISDSLLIERSGRAEPAIPARMPVLADLSAGKIATIDGYVYIQLAVAGYAKIATTRLHLNQINVFPIADADTGTNMVIAMKKPTRNCLLDPAVSIRDAATHLAAETLLHGQGNSGTILGHFYIQLATEIRKTGKDALTVDEFAAVLGVVGASMPGALTDPVEGTMVSVARDSCKSLSGRSFRTLQELIEEWHAAACAELAKTPDQLKVGDNFVLKKAKVVDSGAQGFVYMLEGMLLALKGEVDLGDPANYHSKIAAPVDESNVTIDGHDCESEKFRYCCEAVIRLKEATTKEQLSAAFGALLGDSVVCVVGPSTEGDGQMAKVHIHANEPSNVFDTALGFSTDAILAKEKVEDMLAQKRYAYDAAPYDMSKAKTQVAFINFGWIPPPKAMTGTALNFYVTPSETGEPLATNAASRGDVNVHEYLNYLRHNPQRVYTAALVPATAKLGLLEALKTGHEVLTVSFPEKLSAYTRNLRQARDMLPPAKAAKVHEYVPMGLWSIASVQSAALRAAGLGMLPAEVIEQCKRVDSSGFDIAIMTSAAYQLAAASGRIPPPLQPKKIVDGSVFVMGSTAPLEPHPMKKLMGILSICHTEPPGDGALDRAKAHVVSAIKTELKPGQVLKDVFVNSAGRVDEANAFVAQLASAVPIDGGAEAVVTGGGTLLDGAVSSWGDLKVGFWVDDA